jgi:dTDP-4-amino-4,6-dideoxygalactose transaminase
LPFLPFALPDIGDDEIAEVVDTLRSGWVTTGPKTQRFEADFAAFLGDPSLHCMAVNSATAGLHLALEALGIGPGDEVITTTHTFTATAEVVRYLGADVVLVDIDPATLCIDPKCVEAAITPRTKAIMPVHYAGLASDMPVITPPGPPAGDLHAWHLYVLGPGEGAEPGRRATTRPAMTRDVLIDQLFAAGIGCSVHYIPLHLQPYRRDRYALRPEQFPHSQHAYEQMLSLPIHTRMTDADVQRVASAVRRAFA